MAHSASQEEAAEIGLRYSTDSEPGFSRRPFRTQFRYFDTSGKVITDQSTLDRIAKLAIPPAWKEVWISPSPRGHLQAVGRDAKARKQAIYHPDWVAHRDLEKFARLAEFGKTLPKIRERVEIDLSRHGLPKSKVVAAVVRLLEVSLIRVGNKQYERSNHSFGLTTLHNEHATIGATSIKFSFKGKSGKYHEVTLADRRIASIVRKCHDLPGQALFEYLDDESGPTEINSSDVNHYLHEVAGAEFTAKDFRTWAATVETVRLARALEAPSEKALGSVVKEVAKLLGNTPAICRASYIHPNALCDAEASWLRCPEPVTRQARFGPIETLVLQRVLSESIAKH